MRRLLILSTTLALAVATLTAQVAPIYNRGADRMALLLGRLQTTASALHTGAHPDDEDSSLISRLARGDHARVAYLALNRGEGGQNIIGTELFEALGVLRTEELLQARRLDGGEQLFTRTMDYGFSKTRAEAAAKWDEQEVLKDMVRAIRTFRPLVIASRFSGTPADGHGQHQLAGYLTPIAFKAAADPTQFPEQIAEGLGPWQAKKLYVGQGFRPDPSNPATTHVATGVLDPVIGRTYTEIAMQGRSQHKSQEMGVIELKGPQDSALRLVENLTGSKDADEDSLFTGIDTSFTGLAAVVGLPDGTIAAELKAVADAAREAAAEWDARTPGATIPALARGLTATRAARAALKGLSGHDRERADADFFLGIEEEDFGEALAAAAGLDLDPLSNTETVVPGRALTVTVRVFEGADRLATAGAPAVVAPDGWTVTASGPPPVDSSNPFARFFREHPETETHFTVGVPATAPYTQPYWLRQPREGDRFQWPASGPKGVPFGPPLLEVRLPVTVGGVTFDLVREVEYRYADRVRGELRRHVNVVPLVDVAMDSSLMILPTSDTNETKPIVVHLTSYGDGAVNGRVQLTLPAGWTSEPAARPFALAAAGDEASVSFTVRTPARIEAGSYTIGAQAVVDGVAYDQDMQTIAYPHIQTHRLYAPAAARVQAFDVSVAPVSVGYVMGSGDEVPDAIRRLGLSVELISDEALATGDLSRYDTIVVGIRASEARPAFVANNNRLLDYVRNGGTLIVQYQQADYAQRGLAPFPGEIGPRVTDETAEVRILQPEHRVFTFPNRITSADFEGWVQERNLYSFGPFDDRYVPLLESHDPDEPENRGGELYAELGKGRFVYTSYAWFRQLRAGVPGAYRQFANLLSLGK
ncbi:MAG: NEW3 domain-containing protein [Vicinamibacterales bacterium]